MIQTALFAAVLSATTPAPFVTITRDGGAVLEMIRAKDVRSAVDCAAGALTDQSAGPGFLAIRYEPAPDVFESVRLRYSVRAAWSLCASMDCQTLELIALYYFEQPGAIFGDGAEACVTYGG